MIICSQFKVLILTVLFKLESKQLHLIQWYTQTGPKK